MDSENKGSGGGLGEKPARSGIDFGKTLLPDDAKELPQPKDTPIGVIGSPIKPGKVVQQIGEPTRMTVREVTTSGVVCEWFEGGKLKSGTFAIGGLRLAEEPGANKMLVDGAQFSPRTLGVTLPSAATALSWLDTIAMIAHEANRIWQALHPSEAIPVSPTFLHAPQETIESVIDGVHKIATGEITTPEQSHLSWYAHKQNTGWRYGPEKNEQEKTHPCMVPYSALPPEQRVKDALYFGIVRGLVQAHHEGAF